MGSGVRSGMIEMPKGGAEGGCERRAGVRAVKTRFLGEGEDKTWRN